MLLRRTPLTAALRSHTATLIAKPCSVCICRCGTAVHDNAHSPTQKRWLGRVAPSTRQKRNRQEGFALTPEQVKARQKEKYDDSLWLWSLVDHWDKTGRTSMNPNLAVNFITNFQTLSAKALRQNYVDDAKYKELRDQAMLEDYQVILLARALVQSRDEANKVLGSRLMFTLSHNGYEEATIKVLIQALLGERTKKGLLKASQIVYARGHLREIARKGKSYRAMVLEGKIAYALGDHDYAIQMWTEAMEPAVQAADAAKAWNERSPLQAALQETDSEAKRILHDEVGLTSPWIELTLIYYERYGALVQRMEYTQARAYMDKARETIEVGCSQDDPTSHFHAAVMLAETNEQGGVKYTSSWLYNMTKAAASGHAKAAHTLAEFYAESGWKYIEDEPPDHIKPTPFDSYPVSHTTTSSFRTHWLKLRQLFGLAPTPRPKPSDDLFHTAVFPSTPEQRWRLAIQWLQTSGAYAYAPSFLLAAKINLQPTLWGLARAPPNALHLSPKRYTYASKADFEANNPISSEPRPDAPDIAISHGADETYYTMRHLREVLWAAEAHRLRESKLLRAKARGFTAAIDEGEDMGQWLGQEIPMHIRKWLYNDDIREQYEGEIWNLEKEAKRLADEHGIDIVDEDGGLMYKSRVVR